MERVPYTRLEPTLHFDVTEHKAEGGCPPLAALVLTGVMAATAMGIGWGISYLNQWFYLLIIIPFILSLILAGVGWVGVGYLKIRSEGVAFLIGLLAGCLCWGAIHYFNWQRYRQEATLKLIAPVKQLVGLQTLEEVMLKKAENFPQPKIENLEGHKRRPEIEKRLAEIQERQSQLRERVAEFQGKIADIRKILASEKTGAEAQAVANWLEADLEPIRRRLEQEAEGDPDVASELFDVNTSPLGTKIHLEVLEVLRGWAGQVSFWEYLKARAAAGYHFSYRRFGFPIRGGWAWAGWVMEVLILSLVAGGVMTIRASKPFCKHCAGWKEENKLGRVHMPAQRAVELLKSGAVGQFANEAKKTGDDIIDVYLSTCPNCKTASSVEVRLEKVTVDKEANESTSDLAHVSYPGRALPPLTMLIPPVEVDRPPEEPTDSHLV